VQDVLSVLARVLGQAGLSHALIGGHAVNAWLEPRFTADIDLVIAVDAAALGRFRKALAAEGIVVDVEYGAQEPSGPDFVRFVSADGLARVEIQVAKTPFQREVIQRARADDIRLRVATPEDLIVMKLIANRPKDQIDLIGLLGLAALDWSYIERWADEWGVTDVLRRAAERVPRS
jgi:hypothetical protein